MMIKHGSMPIEDLDLMMEYQEMTLGYLDLTRQQRNILLFGYPSIFTDGRSSDIKSDIPSDAKSDIKADPKNDTKASTTDTSSVAAAIAATAAAATATAAIAATAAAATATAAVAALPALATPLPAVVLQAPGPTTQLVLPVLTHGRSFTISNQCQQAVILTPSSEQDTKQSHGDNNPNPPKTTSSQCPANPFKPEIASDMWLNIMNHALQLSHMGRYRDSETHLRKMTQEYELSSGQLTGAYFNLALNVFLIGRNEKNNLLLDQALKLLDVPFVEGETADHPALLGKSCPSIFSLIHADNLWLVLGVCFCFNRAQSRNSNRTKKLQRGFKCFDGRFTIQRHKGKVSVVSVSPFHDCKNARPMLARFIGATSRIEPVGRTLVLASSHQLCQGRKIVALVRITSTGNDPCTGYRTFRNEYTGKLCVAMCDDAATSKCMETLY